MIQILNYLQKYWKNHFHLSFYLTTALFLSIYIFINYQPNLHVFLPNWMALFKRPLVVSFPFLVICAFMYVFNINKAWLKSKEFWLLFSVSFILLGFFLNASSYGILEYFGINNYYTYQLFWNVKSFFVVFVPLILFYYFYERHRDQTKSWYGLKMKDTDFKPYFVLITLVFIGVGFASFLSDLTTYYPLFNKSGGDEFAKTYNSPSWLMVMFFELFYGLNFLNVEFLFRGFLVIGFARVLGGHAVMAMVGCYVAVHFGKPLTECISSAFGGYIIGVLAFYSNRIWGGVVLHIALAWSMEFFGWLQNL